MQSFFKNYKLDRTKSWLILGKGPSFDEFPLHDLEKYNVLGLNEVCQIVKCQIGHFIDVEVLSHNFIENCEAIVSPVRPHKNCKVSVHQLASWFLLPYDEDLGALNKLYCYNCSTYKSAHFTDFGPVVKVRYFSVEAAFRLLGMSDIKKIYTLGIDGGFSYANVFKHLKPLRNGRDSFQDQFKELESIIHKFDIVWVPLNKPRV